MKNNGIRKNVAHISKEERGWLRNAIIALNKKFYPGRRHDAIVGGVSYWFKQDEIHQATHVHGGPAFLPWHRELCNRFEILLREVDPRVSLHYWDWNSDPHPKNNDSKIVNLFTDDFMGSDNGLAGEPWLSAGFYDPEATPYRGEEAFDFAHSNPFDPPRELRRNLKDGAPSLPYPENKIIEANDFKAMRIMLEANHNYTHDYVGGTIGDPHTSFRDPFVFLLHSNVDRLYSTWQLQPGTSWRLDPEFIYGEEDNTKTKGTFPEAHIGILSPLEPWAGASAKGAEEEVVEIRPWAAPEFEHLLEKNQKNSKHSSLVSNPPLYDTTVGLK